MLTSCHPRGDGDREALRILLTARQELTTASTAQTNRLRALLLGGDDPDRSLARDALTEAALAGLARRRPPREASRQPAMRHAEIRRLTLALRAAARELKANRVQLQTIVNDVVPGTTWRPKMGPCTPSSARPRHLFLSLARRGPPPPPPGPPAPGGFAGLPWRRAADAYGMASISTTPLRDGSAVMVQINGFGSCF